MGRPQDQRAKGRRKRQRTDGGQGHGYGERQGELLVESAGDPAHEGDGHENRNEHQGDGHHRPGHFGHGRLGGLARRQLVVVDLVLHRLHHHDGVVHHDADGKHQAEQGQRVDRKAEDLQEGEGPHQRYRHGEHGNERGPAVLQKDVDHDEDQDHGFEQGLYDLVDGGGDEFRGVVGNGVVHTGREVAGLLGHEFAELFDDIEGVGAGKLEDLDGTGGFAV